MNSIKIIAKNEEVLQKVLKFVSKFNADDVFVELPDTVADSASTVLSERAVKRYGKMIIDAKRNKNVYKFETASKAMDFLIKDSLPTRVASERVIQNAKSAMSKKGMRTSGELASKVLFEITK